MNKFTAWFGGLISAIAGAIVTVIPANYIAPQVFNLQDGFYNLLMLCYQPAAVAVLLYLKQSPLPGMKIGGNNG